MKPLDKRFRMWYNYDALSLEPGRASFLLIENRIPNNRYVPTDAGDCKRLGDKTEPKSSARDPDRGIATNGTR